MALDALDHVAVLKKLVVFRNLRQKQTKQEGGEQVHGERGEVV